MVDLANMSPEAVAAWKRLNEAWGRPIPVSSAYRDPETNKRVGGAKGSQHLHGNAFDITTAGMSPQEIDALIKAGVKAGFRGFGGYDGSVHFDVGPQRTWGPSYGSDTTPQYLRAALSGAEFSPMTYATPTISTKGGQAVNPDEIEQAAAAQSTGGGILNMLGGQQQQRPPLRERFRDPNFWNEVALTFHSMSSFPNEQAISALQSRVERSREAKKEQDQLNKTIAFFDKFGNSHLSELARVSPSAALSLYAQMQKPTADKGASSTIGKIMDDYRRGLITKEQMEVAVAKAGASSGFSVRTNPDGTVEIVQGAPKLTEGQGKATGFYGRAKSSHETLSSLEKSGTALYDAIVSNIPIAGNYMISEEYQKYAQAQRDFINALLRNESGATIGPDEFANAKQQYFPQPGDTQAVIDQKRKNRETAIDALRIAAGPGAGQLKSNDAITPPATPPAQGGGFKVEKKY